jgi:hypothetical protein
VLVVDHIVPLHWGGKNELDNYQPLCEQCNGEKKAFLATFDRYTNEIRAAAQEEEPHRRIGELLKAFEGNWVPSEILGVVASFGRFQEDWQKRLRELRLIGWKIDSRRKKDPSTNRIMVEYRATHWEAWPSGPVRAEIARHDPSSSAYIGPWERSN